MSPFIFNEKKMHLHCHTAWYHDTLAGIQKSHCGNLTGSLFYSVLVICKYLMSSAHI